MSDMNVMPLVAAQPGIWMAEQLADRHNAWSVAHYVTLHGELDETRLDAAIRAGLAEADTLRMAFGERDGAPVQWLEAQRAVEAPLFIDLRGESDPQAAALRRMQRDLAQALRAAGDRPLYRHEVLRVADDRWCWYQRYHHLLVDGFSFTAITRRIAAIYTALSRGEEPGPSPFVPFREVVDEYQGYQASTAYRRDAEFWAGQMKTLPPAATLSARPLAGQRAGTQLIRHTQTFDQADFRRLAAHGQSRGLSAADLALALVALWLSRLTGRPALSAGFIFMRRIGSAALCATGPVLNVLPAALRVEGQQSLLDLAETLARQMKTLRRHQRYDAEQILRDLGRVGSDEPLYGPVINLKMFDWQVEMPGLTATTHQLASGPVRDLELALYLDEQHGLGLEVLANAERYQADELAGHLARLPLLLRQFADQPDLACAAVQLLHPQEQALLARVNDTAHPLADTTLSALIAAQAARTPDAPALADDQYQFSYRAMRRQVLALAEELRARGVRPGDVVAVAQPRSVFLSLSLQAVVEVGAAWLPLDTGYPDERLRMMLEDAAPRLIVTTREQQSRFSGIEALCYQTPLAEREMSAALALSRPAHTAYVIYTSGSTGRPKGVMVGQRAIVNRLLWMQDRYPLGADDVVLQKTPCSFDVSVWEFFWPLLAGAQLVMAPPEAHRDPEALQALFTRWRVTTAHFVPSMLAAFVAALTDDDAVARCATLRRVFCSGEALPADLCRRWEALTGAPLHNLYGPTEAAVDVSGYPAYGEALAQVTGSSVPIGFPVWNTGLRILDAWLQPVPPGIAGDLYLTGVQLAQGYLARPDLTASRFVADPFAPGKRMYRTGDVARWLPDGAVEYLGRSDDQLKLRGQRIELGDIDRALLSLPDVAQAVTHACVLNQSAGGEGDARQLVGYVVSGSGAALDGNALRAALGERLPAHMVPVALVQLSVLPLSANGKLDRKALPIPAPANRAPGRAPQTALEQAVAAAFSELLQVAIPDVEADFFALGGHSLLAMQLAATLRRRLARPVTVGQVMVSPTVAQLAARLEQEHTGEQAGRSGFETLLPLRQSSGPTLFCFHPASGFAWQFSVLLRWLDPRWSVTGIQSPRPHGPMQQAQSLDQVCDAHLRTLRASQPHGPYYLMGYSLGGTLAQGIAARLRAEGEQVAFLGLLDTWPPETQNWAEKGEPDAAVLAEINREREAFLAAQQQRGSDALFDTIEGNYADAVRLLTTARSAAFDGEATLFVAERTRRPGLDAVEAWSPWIARPEAVPVDCAHVDIIGPQAFDVIGPHLQRLLALD